MEEGKQTAIISYITIIGTIIAIFMNNEKKNTFNAFWLISKPAGFALPEKVLM